MKKILVTGSGGIGGVNFIRALRSTKEDFFIIGTDFNNYYLQFPDADIRINSPRHTDPKFLDLVKQQISEHNVDFLHPQPSSEALVISKNIDQIEASTLLPKHQVIAADKSLTQQVLQKNGLPVATTKIVESHDKIENSFNELSKGNPLWVRSKSGAGGNLSLLCNDSSEAELWMNLWTHKKNINYNDFLIQEYLPGKNVAWDSFWYNGKFIASFTRERIEYPFKHISPSGITGTPTVSRIIVDSKIDEIAKKSVLAMDNKPHGNYAVDLKGDSNNNYFVTEIDSGKFHTTTPLWGYISTHSLKQDVLNNLPFLYIQLGTNAISDPQELGSDIYPEGIYLIRHMDCGVWIWKEDGFKEKVL